MVELLNKGADRSPREKQPGRTRVQNEPFSVGSLVQGPGLQAPCQRLFNVHGAIYGCGENGQSNRRSRMFIALSRTVRLISMLRVGQPMDAFDDGWSGSDTESDSGSSWGGGFILGLILLIVSVFGLFWNEGRAVTAAQSVTEAARAIAEVNPAAVDRSMSGKLVHISGRAEPAASLKDSELGFAAAALKLVRTVEMYQWKESQTKDGGYSYRHEWAQGRVDSSKFHQSKGHRNPDPIFENRELEAQEAKLGAYVVGADALKKLPARTRVAVPAAIADAINAKYNRPVSIVDGALYIGADPSAPRTGDLRITIRIAPAGPISLIGRQSGAELTSYATKAGDRPLMVSPGIVSAEDMFSQARATNSIVTWIIRLLGFVAMWFGFYLLMSPLVSLVEEVPVLGSLLAAGASLVALAFTAIAAPATIAVAWLYYRPLVAILILAGGAALVYLVRLRAEQAAASPKATWDQRAQFVQPSSTAMPSTPPAPSALSRRQSSGFGGAAPHMQATRERPPTPVQPRQPVSGFGAAARQARATNEGQPTPFLPQARAGLR
jgi:hypothetical protein